MGIHLRVVSESYPMKNKMNGFRWFSKIFATDPHVLWTKVALTLDGLKQNKSKNALRWYLNKIIKAFTGSIGSVMTNSIL